MSALNGFAAGLVAAAVFAALAGCAEPSSARPANEADPRLMDAIDRGDVDGVRSALARKPNLEPTCDPNAICKPLARAAQTRNIEIVTLLIAAGADPNGQNAYGDTAFMTAANAPSGTDPKEVRAVQTYLLQHGADPNQPNQFGGTPFMGAAALGDIAMLELALAHGGEVNSPSFGPLHAAAQFGQPEAAEWLLRHGADPDQRSKSGATPRDTAAEHGHPEVVAVLDRANARRQ